ncbi:hypothetical protein K0M31_004913 [Melipona bicolor]|uniref:Uncharacterized protein n=1 Tax=Melipona bicolor TaxID=60889 RepID=A0AA40FVR3_9HYME|nr:hypothetical protein K0M31_004913 [Melipona bicolor]
MRWVKRESKKAKRRRCSMKRHALRSIDRAFGGTQVAHGPGMEFLEILVTRMTAGRTENQPGLM